MIKLKILRRVIFIGNTERKLKTEQLIKPRSKEQNKRKPKKKRTKTPVILKLGLRKNRLKNISLTGMTLVLFSTLILKFDILNYCMITFNIRSSFVVKIVLIILTLTRE